MSIQGAPCSNLDDAASPLTHEAEPTVSRWPVHLALATQVAISAGTYLVAKSALASFSPLEVMVLRLAGTAPLFIALLRALPAPRLPARSELLPIALLGLLGAPLNQGLFLLGLRSSTPNHAALLYAMTPLLVFIIAAVAGHERARPLRLAGIGVALGGVLVILNERGLGDEAAIRRGDLLIFLGVLAWALYSAFGRQRATAHGAFRVTCWTMIAGAAFALPFAPFVVDPSRLAAAPASAWAGIGYLCLLTSFVAYLLWYFALERMEASRVTVWSNLQPVATAALSWAIHAAPIGLAFTVGGALVIGGVMLTQRG